MKDIPGYEELYAIEEDGRVWSYKSKKYIKQWIDGHNGYYMVRLHKNKIQENKCVHRLLAETYIPNPENLPTVDHIDQQKLHNELSNLRWASRHTQELNKDRTLCDKLAGERAAAGIPNPLKKVIRIDKNGKEKLYNSLSDAAFDTTGDRKKTPRICNCCKGIRKTYKGYYWKYAE